MTRHTRADGPDTARRGETEAPTTAGDEVQREHRLGALGVGWRAGCHQAVKGGRTEQAPTTGRTQHGLHQGCTGMLFILCTKGVSGTFKKWNRSRLTACSESGTSIFQRRKRNLGKIDKGPSEGQDDNTQGASWTGSPEGLAPGSRLSRPTRPPLRADADHKPRLRGSGAGPGTREENRATGERGRGERREGGSPGTSPPLAWRWR